MLVCVFGFLSFIILFDVELIYNKILMVIFVCFRKIVIVFFNLILFIGVFIVEDFK